jgi:putative phosphoribosyl transferase
MFNPPMAAAERQVSVPLGSLAVPGVLAWPEHPSGVVLFAHGSDGETRRRERDALARQLRAAGLATLVFDLLTPREQEAPARGFEAALLAGRLGAATEWLLDQPESGGLVPGYLGLGTAAGAALRAAAASRGLVGAVVCHAGRPDLAGDALYGVRAPTLLIAGSHDETGLEPNRQAYRCLGCVKRLVVIPGAAGAFEDPVSLAEAGRWTAEWFVQHLVMVPRWQSVRRSSLVSV